MIHHPGKLYTKCCFFQLNDKRKEYQTTTVSSHQTKFVAPSLIPTGGDETKRKTQERMERRSRKRSSSAGNEQMERVGDRQGKMERYCSTGQSPQWAVAPTEEEEYLIPKFSIKIFPTISLCSVVICTINRLSAQTNFHTLSIFSAIQFFCYLLLSFPPTLHLLYHTKHPNFFTSS
jgi:hypothetical protein